MPEPPYIYRSDGSVAQGRVVRPVSVVSLDLDGVALTFIRVDGQSRLQFGEAEIVIEAAFVLTTPAGETHELDPEDRAKLGPLLALYPDTLTSGFAATDCSLRLTFASGTTVVVSQDPHYEAWLVSGPGSRLIVCPPAGTGELSVWA